MDRQLWATIGALEKLLPEFVSVTYGAGGTTRETTFATVKRLAETTHLRPAAHLTCVGHHRTEVEELLRRYWDAGIRHIVALRGDPPAGQRFVAHPDGFSGAVELVAGIKKVADFEVSVAAYPEIHPEALSATADLDNLRQKFDAGADRAITQFFFENQRFLDFLDRAEAARVQGPIVPGILPVTNFSQAQRFAKMCGAHVPDWMADLFEGLDEDPDTRKLVAAMVATEQIRNLQAAGVGQFHIYTLNRADLTLGICRRMGLKPAKAAELLTPLSDAPAPLQRDPDMPD